MLKSTVANIFNDFISLFYPDYCIACSDSLIKGEQLVCTKCIMEMPQTQFHLDRNNPLRSRLSHRFPVDQGLAFLKFSKSGKVQQLLHSLKYKNQPEIGQALGRVYGNRIKSSISETPFDVIIPVPLHKSKLRRRGYNQSTKFAEGLSESLNIPVVENFLVRKKETQTQTRKSKLKRWENVSEVFEVENASQLEGKHILITDDVITTGATIEACGVALLNRLDCKISVACIAVA